jgi:hypothetical protein
MAKIASRQGLTKTMTSRSAREAKYDLGRLIDTARAAPVVIEKYRRSVVAVLSSVVVSLSIEEYERLKAIGSKREAA